MKSFEQAHQRTNCDGAYERPADAFLSGSISSFVENGLVRNAMHPELQRSLANGKVPAPGNEITGTNTPEAFEIVSQFDP